MKKTGLEQITEERLKQIAKYGWSGYHDVMYKDQELLKAAAAYLMHCLHGGAWASYWPWDMSTFKDEGYVENLKKVGAFVAAELDRLNVVEDENV